jgi:drug/metabolite transporter (DMT)-like permease
MNMSLATLCVLLFSLTVPFTRLAALEMPALLVMGLRLCGAALVCALFLLRDPWWPPRRIWLPLLLTMLASVVGFSLLTALALQQVPGTHGAIGLASLPAVTALYAALRDRVQPPSAFWGFAVLGTVLSSGYLLLDAAGGLMIGDALLMMAVLAAAFGYVEGARLSREFGGRRIMSWAILLSLPLALGVTFSQLDDVDLAAFSTTAWTSVFYLAVISQSLGMMLWYRVLATGPMEKVALVQLLQPFFTLLSAHLLLGEAVAAQAWIVALLVVFCIVGANRSKSRPALLPVVVLPALRREP